MATSPNSPAALGAAPARRFLPLLLCLFVGSGCAALIYEIVWFQLLQLVIGATAASLGLLLGSFMGGMCLGSLLLPRLISPRAHPLRVYALLEAGIGICGLLVLWGEPLVQHIYVAVVGHGAGAVMLRGLVSAVCLLPPTILMGASLPAMARWMETTPKGVAWLGFFYGGNIAGAVGGSLLAGFYLLRVYDMATATYAAVAINFTVALIGYLIANETDHVQPQAKTRGSAQVPRAPGAWVVYLTIGLSGFTALGAEVVWTRLLSLLLGGTVYAFSIILAVFLVGLGLGSSVGSFWARYAARPRLAFALCQAGLVLTIAWTAWMVAGSLPYWPIDPTWAPSPGTMFQLDMARCLWAVFPPTVLWGASFPLALAAVAAPGEDSGKLVGGVYAANTVGAILGSLLFSLIIIPHHGTQHAEMGLIVAAALSAILLLLSLTRNFPGQNSPAKMEPAGSGLGWSGSIVLVLVPIWAAILAANVPNIPAGLVGYGRLFQYYVNQGLPKFDFVGEGMTSTVAVSHFADGSRNFHVSGKIEASTIPTDMRLQRMLGLLPGLINPAPHSVLIVGCGAGVTAGSFMNFPTIDRIVICEIEPLIPQVVAQYFGPENYHIVEGIKEANPRTINGKNIQIIYDDGRHFLLTTHEHFDIITSDPIHPWVKGSAVLYTKEYFELAKEHLNPGGLVTQWVPLYESNRAAVLSELRTFFEVFPEGTLWGNEDNSAGYDSVVLGQKDPAPINLEEIALRLQRPEYKPVVDSLANVGFDFGPDLFSTYAGYGPDMQPLLADAEINSDRNLRLQYVAGFGLNDNAGAKIYEEILNYRTAPTRVMTGDPQLFNLVHWTHAGSGAGLMNMIMQSNTPAPDAPAPATPASSLDK